MTSHNLGQKRFFPTPPEKGVFPLDHDAQCKREMLKYMICLQNHENDNSLCRHESKDYLDCRMKNNLMAPENWSYLGFSDLEEKSKPVTVLKMKKNILLCCTGSVATIKAEELVNYFNTQDFNVKVILTKAAEHFCKKEDIKAKNIEVYTDENEWSLWKDRGDPVLHIDVGKWADILVIAPIDANTLAKISQGLCDNLLTCVVRAWDTGKPLLFCPAMNTRMYLHPITESQISQLESWGYKHVPCVSKTLMCGDTGIGAMAPVDIIVEKVKKLLFTPC